MLFEDPVVVTADGQWDRDLKAGIQDWWSLRIPGLDVEQ